MDINVIAENLAELLTNTVNMTSIYYDIFLNPEPMDVELQMYNDENELVTITIPNRAKDKAMAYSGSGSPEGIVEAPVGSAYVDTANSTVYYKIQGNDQFGWQSVLSQNLMMILVRSYLEARGYITENGVRRYLNENGYIKSTDTASASTYGVVKIDNSTVTMNGNGQLVVEGIKDTGTLTSPVRVWTGLSSDYADIENKDPATLYILTDTGEILLGINEMAEVSFPSADSQTWVLGATGASYVAPANGWLYFSKLSSNSSGSTDVNYIKVSNSTTGIDLIEYGSSNRQLSILMPASKGNTLVVSYTATGTTQAFKFIYAQSIEIGTNAS